MANDQVINFAIQPARSVIRDVASNKFWVIGFILFIFLVISVSSVLFHWLEKDQCVSWVSSFYFTIINLTTVGFGDVVPKSDAGKFLAIINSLIGVISFGFLVAIIAAALQPSEFTGTGIVPQSNGPQAPSPDTQRSHGGAEPEPFRQETLRFLSSLNALIGDQEQRRRETRIRIRLAPTEGGTPDTIVEVDIFVHRWP